MYPVCTSNGPIGVEGSHVQGTVNGNIGGAGGGSALPALLGLRQALPIQSLYFKHACTQRAPDVICQN